MEWAENTPPIIAYNGLYRLDGSLWRTAEPRPFRSLGKPAFEGIGDSFALADLIVRTLHNSSRFGREIPTC